MTRFTVVSSGSSFFFRDGVVLWPASEESAFSVAVGMKTPVSSEASRLMSSAQRLERGKISERDAATHSDTVFDT